MFSGSFTAVVTPLKNNKVYTFLKHNNNIIVC